MLSHIVVTPAVIEQSLRDFEEKEAPAERLGACSCYGTETLTDTLLVTIIAHPKQETSILSECQNIKFLFILCYKFERSQE